LTKSYVDLSSMTREKVVREITDVMASSVS